MPALNAPISLTLGVVPVESTGAVADGVTDCYDAIIAAIAKAGSTGIVRFKKGTYYVEDTAGGGADSPDFTGAFLEFEPGATLSIENVTSNNFRDWKFITPATVYVRNRSGGTVVQPNYGLTQPLNASDGSLTFKPTVVDFTTWTSALWTQPDVDQTTGTDGTTKTASQITWAAASITSGQTQVAYTATTGATDEFQVALNAKASVSSARAGLLVRCGTGEHWFFFLPDWRTLTPGFVPTYYITRLSGTWTAEARTFSWGNEAYFYDNAAIPMLSVRITGTRSADFYINGVYVDSITTLADITDIGVAANGDVDLNEVSFRYGSRMSRPSAPRGRDIKLGVVGDSVMNGIAASRSVAEVVCDLLVTRAGIPFASVELDVSVPGHKADQQEVAAEEADWSDCDYVLVSVGANDAGQAVALSTYISNLEGIIDAIEADGAIPIFGTFHNFISQTISDHTYDNSIANVWYRHGNYRAAALYVAASKGVRVADIPGAVGHVGEHHEQLLDGVHLSHIGIGCYASAFADAIIQDLGGN